MTKKAKKVFSYDEKVFSYDATEEELELIERAALKRAWMALAPLGDEKTSVVDGVRACLEAFRQANAVMERERKKLYKAHPEVEYVSLPTSITGIVCSALCGIDMSPEDIHPQSIAGQRFAIFAQAVVVLQAVGAVDVILDERIDLLSDSLGGMALRALDVARANRK